MMVCLNDTLPIKQTANYTNMLVQDNDIWTLKLAGDINANTSLIFVPDILQKLEEAQAQLLVIDLTAVENIDAFGLRLLLTLKKELATQNIQIELQNPTPSVGRLFRILRFDRAFVIKQAT